MQTLKRYPVKKNDPLQAWDSADELILRHMQSQDLAGKRILIINDHFGALSCGLEAFDCATYTDSYVAMMGIRQNSAQRLQPINSLKALTGLYDFVLIQIPKNMSYFEDILCRLTRHLHAQSQLVCGSMVKHLAPTSFELLQKYIGETTTSLAEKKARLVFARFEKAAVTSPYPQSVKLDGFDIAFSNNSNLFSRDKLDIGSRFFLSHLPKGNFKTILDLGCANGVIGIKAKMLHPDAKITFSDESAMAIESAQTNYQHHFKDEAHYIWTNCFEGQAKGTMDLVLCNPPFHQGTTVGDFIAQQMFLDAFDALKVGGFLRVIGNTHLGYQVRLKKLFGAATIVATNQKFLICEAQKRQ